MYCTGSGAYQDEEGTVGFKKHYLGLSDNVTYFAEQIAVAQVSSYHYNVIFKPQSILPSVEINARFREALDAVVPDVNVE